MHKRERQNGFTLVELLAAMLIMGMILTVTGGILVTTLKARKNIQDTFKKSNQGVAILQIMSRDISAATRPDKRIKNQQGSPQPNIFYGKNDGSGPFGKDELDFVTTENTWDPASRRFADISECGYLLKENPDASSLFRLYRRSQPWIDEDPVRGGTLTKLHDRVAALNFEYLKQVNNNNNNQPQTRWVEEWDDKEEKGLPLAVRISLTVRPKTDEDDDASDSGRENEKTFETIVSLSTR